MKKPKTEITVKGLSEDRKKMTVILMALSAGFYELRLRSYKKLKELIMQKIKPISEKTEKPETTVKG